MQADLDLGEGRPEATTVYWSWEIAWTPNKWCPSPESSQ
ncbi:hypothetical protein STPH2_3298 [Streptomyces sp. KO7888]|nr:hypothetical protein [Streptomyces sp. KO7888]